MRPQNKRLGSIEGDSGNLSNANKVSTIIKHCLTNFENLHDEVDPKDIKDINESSVKRRLTDQILRD